MDAKALGAASAYPDGTTNEWGNATSRGLTRRELFAALAMQGILANPSPQCVTWDEEKVAFVSVQHADALLKELASE